MNNHVVLLVGKSATGKSGSLMNMKNPEGVAYFNCEAGKQLPFKSKFKKFNITDPTDVPDGIKALEGESTIHTIVVDSLTFLMEMYESVYVIGAANTMAAWGNYAQYFKTMMQQTVAASTKNIIFTAHTSDVYNEKEMVSESMVKVKGSTMNQGVEAFFTTVVACKKIDLVKLEPYKSDLLHITEDDKMLGYKHVIQTRLTKDTVNERIRNPMGLFAVNETFIDGNSQLLLDRLHDYYGE